MKNLLQVLKDKIFRDDIVTQAAALALYTAFAMAPLLLLLLSFLSTLQLSLQEPLIAQVRQLMGIEAASVLETIIHSSRENSTSQASIWGIVVLGVSASVIFAQLQSSLNLIFQSESPAKDLSTKDYVQQFISRRLICFGMVLTFIFVSIVSLVISSVLALMFTGPFAIWMKTVQILGSFAVYALLFAIILRWMPDRKVPWTAAIRGGLLTSLLFMVGKVLIGAYIGNAALGSAYGAAGSLIVLLAWVYYSSLIVLLGAEISAALIPENRRMQTV